MQKPDVLSGFLFYINLIASCIFGRARGHRPYTLLTCRQLYPARPPNYPCVPFPTLPLPVRQQIMLWIVRDSRRSLPDTTLPCACPTWLRNRPCVLFLFSLDGYMDHALPHSLLSLARRSTSAGLTMAWRSVRSSARMWAQEGSAARFSISSGSRSTLNNWSGRPT